MRGTLAIKEKKTIFFVLIQSQREEKFNKIVIENITTRCIA